MKRHNFFLPEDLVASLKTIAENTGVPMSELIRRALSNWLVEYNVKQKELAEHE